MINIQHYVRSQNIAKHYENFHYPYLSKSASGIPRSEGLDSCPLPLVMPPTPTCKKEMGHPYPHGNAQNLGVGLKCRGREGIGTGPKAQSQCPPLVTSPSPCPLPLALAHYPLALVFEPQGVGLKSFPRKWDAIPYVTA